MSTEGFGRRVRGTPAGCPGWIGQISKGVPR